MCSRLATGAAQTPSYLRLTVDLVTETLAALSELLTSQATLTAMPFKNGVVLQCILTMPFWRYDA